MKAVQNDCVDKLSVGDLLDTMDVFSDGSGRTRGTDGAVAKGADVDLMQDPVWSKIMLVRPVPVTDEDYTNTSEPDAPHLCDLQGFPVAQLTLLFVHAYFYLRMET